MIATVGERSFRISFQHFNPVPKKGEIVPPKRKRPISWTSCKIEELIPGEEKGKEICAVTAYCSRLDIFNKAVGRKLALARALETALFERDERTAVWSIYWETKAKC